MNILCNTFEIRRYRFKWVKLPGTASYWKAWIDGVLISLTVLGLTRTFDFTALTSIRFSVVVILIFTGYKPGTTDLLEYTVITTTSSYMDFSYNVLTGYVIYTTLSCENNAGLTSVLSSNGVKISNQPPSIDAAEVEVVPLSATAYTPRDMFQGLSDTMRLKWSGFTDNIGVETYKVTLFVLV